MLTKYGQDNIIIMLSASVVLLLISIFVLKGWVSWLPGIAAVLLAIFTLWFFRDPDRNVPAEAVNDPSIIVSPADGTVIEIIPVKEDVFLKADAVRISIFLSPLDVHVNRIPVSGIVKYLKYYPGKYLVAWHPKSSILNEQTHIGVENSAGRVFFKQIVGVVARRLTWDIKTGDTVKVGNRFGMMKFGSRMDVILPAGSSLGIKKGDKVTAGETVLGRLIQ